MIRLPAVWLQMDCRCESRNARLSQLLTMIESASEHCVEEVQSLKRELFPLQPGHNEIPFSRTVHVSPSPSYSNAYSQNRTDDAIKSSNIANLLFMLLRQQNETNNRLHEANTRLMQFQSDTNNHLLQLQAENAELKRSILRLEQKLSETNSALTQATSEYRLHGNCLDKIPDFPRQIASLWNSTSWLQAVNTSLASAAATAAGSLLKDIQQKPLQTQLLSIDTSRLINESIITTSGLPLRPCYGKSSWNIIFNGDRSNGKTYRKLSSSPDGIICVSQSNTSSPLGNFMIYNKTGWYMSFLGTESRNSPFFSYLPFVKWALTLVPGYGDGIRNCIRGVRSIPQELWENRNSSSWQLTDDCFEFSWRSNHDGALVSDFFSESYPYGMYVWY